MRQRGNVVRGRFGGRRGHETGLPPDLVSLLEAERRRRSWRRYAGLWGGAVAVGLVIGVGPSLLRSTPSVSTDIKPEIALQTALEETATQADREWSARTVDSAMALEAAKGTAFGYCYTGGGTNCVVDGDTIWIDGEKVRVADIDAPETHDYRCQEEKALGDRATQRLIQLVNGGSVTLQPIDRDQDVYGRKLRIVLVNGTSVGDALVSEGLARRYDGGRKPWC